MKNIHLLPTTKEQHSIIQKNGGLLLVQTPDKVYTGTKLNIYITSDEKPKKGDWCYDRSVEGRLVRYTELPKHWVDTQKKIILTTDQDLIVDGVQAIDDDFLEWFVNNPSCEFVEISDLLIVTQNEPLIQHQGSKPLVAPHTIIYRIIIPKEDLTKEEEDTFFVNHVCGTQEESKQETLEEAAQRMWNDPNEQLTSKSSFIEGAKWQAERMYSEDEVRNIANWAFDFYKTDEFSDSELEDEFNRILSERFKKK
jgi:hypothetical protein